jgi:hypothetical protein
MIEEAIVDDELQIEKMDMKGGWHFVKFAYDIPKTGLPFGWLVVKGSIDDLAIEQFKLWPTKTGELFVPLKAEIRKKIKKGFGQKIRLRLFLDDSTVEIPEEFKLCLSDSPKAEAFFNGLRWTSQKQYIDWIYAAKSNDIKAKRMTACIIKLEKHKKYHE